MRHPKELGKQELEAISTRVRTVMVAKFGSLKASMFFFSHSEMAVELMRQTYIAVREQLETELNEHGT